MTDMGDVKVIQRMRSAVLLAAFGFLGLFWTCVTLEIYYKL